MPPLKTLIIASTLSGLSACVTGGAASASLPAEASQKEMSGWFSATGEWILFPEENFSSYNPYTKDDNKKCTSLVNNTSVDRESFRNFDKKRVIVKGYEIKYDSLEEGKTKYDILLSKKYFNGEIVENYCLRDVVFIVQTIEIYHDN